MARPAALEIETEKEPKMAKKPRKNTCPKGGHHVWKYEGSGLFDWGKSKHKECKNCRAKA